MSHVNWRKRLMIALAVLGLLTVFLWTGVLAGSGGSVSGVV